MADTEKEKHQEPFLRIVCISVTFQIPGTDRHQLHKKSGGDLSTAAAKSAESKIQQDVKSIIFKCTI